MLVFLIACSPAVVTLGSDDVRLSRMEGEDTDSGADSDADTDADSDSDTDTRDTADTADTPTDTADTSDTGTLPCEGLTIPSARASVSSAETEATIEVVLEGCATGIRVDDNGFQNGQGYSFSGTWAYVPESVDGSATAVLEFTGAGVSTGAEMWFYFESDQGDRDLFVLEVREF